jgi:large subunit ribosomal protein L2
MNYFKALTKKEPEKKLIMRLTKKGGRGGMGRITIRHQGAGAKQMYRMVSFGQEKMDAVGKVIAIEYDPNRTSFIALVEYADKDRKYIIAPDGIKVGDEVVCSEKAEAKLGNRMRIKNIPLGTQVHNIELVPGLEER